MLSGYKPHLALLDWHNERSGPGRAGPGRARPLPWGGKCIAIHGEREKEGGGCGEEEKKSGRCLFKLDLSDQNFMQGCNWWYNVAL